MIARISAIRFLIFIIALATLQAGCTAIGVMTGSKMDEAVATKKHVSKDEIKSLALNQLIRVTSTNGDSIVGRNGGVVPGLDHDKFAALYDSVRARLVPVSAMPALNERVMIEFRGGFIAERVFAGLDRQAVAVSYPATSKAFRVPLENVQSISDLQGNKFDLRGWDEVTQSIVLVPTFDLIVKTGNSERRIPLEDIDSISYDEVGVVFQTFCGALGLAFDVSITIASYMFRDGFLDFQLGL